MDGWGVLEQASELDPRGQAFALATVVWRQGPSSSQQGARAIITADGELHGWIGGACAEPAVIREAQRVIADGAPRLLLLGSPDQFGATVPEGMTVVPISCQSEGALEVYIEPVLPAPHLVIVGRSPMAQTLADLGRSARLAHRRCRGRGLHRRGRGPRALDGRRGHPGPRRRGGGRAGGRRPARLPGPGRLAPPGRRRARLPRRPGPARRTSSTGSACRPGSTWATSPTRRSPSRSWPSWSSSARRARSERPPEATRAAEHRRPGRCRPRNGPRPAAGRRPGLRDDRGGG